MATQYTSLLGLALPVTGELQGTWGDTVNNSITSLLDTAVAGTTTLSTDGDVTLSTTTGASNQARQAVLLCTGARTALRTITAPAQSKTYTVINATTGGFSIKVVGVGPTTGVTIAAGESALIAWNGSDFIKISNTGGAGTFTNLTVTGNLTVNSLTNARVPYASTSGLLVDSANMTFNGTRLTVADLADSGLTPTRVVYSTTGGALVDSANLTFDGTNLTLGGGTANGVAYLNGSKVLTTGTGLQFDGNNLGLGVTPSAWSLGKAIEVNNTGNALWGVASSEIDVAQNGYYNGGWKYAASSYASRYEQNTGVHKWWVAPSGTAGNAISFTQAMTLDASGNLGVGTTSPGARVTVAGGRLQVTGNTAPSSGTGLELFYDGTGAGTLAFARGIGYIPNFMDGSQLQFFTSSTERARIDSSGGFRVNVTGNGLNDARIYARANSGGTAMEAGIDAISGTLIRFSNSQDLGGSISIVSGGTTSYNTSSDYRLKENIQPMTGALAKVQALKPCTYTWKADGSDGEGFIAHELAEVVPQCVTGEKDAVDAEGKPVYQGIDTSFLVATLTAAIQEQQAIINQLKARLDAANL